MRDTRVGMLPPKLAQIIVNLAIEDNSKPEEAMVLDPFCGTGVILQEAALMGLSVYGTDLEPRMVQYSIDNLTWLKNRFGVDFYARVEVGDATKTRWSNTNQITAVACETYLGAPMAGRVTLEYIEQERTKAQKLLKQALQNISSQITPGTRCCFAVPAWFYENRTITLPLIDQITDMGYNLVSFRHTPRASMIYHREDQVVGRQLITCIKK
jgi:tRNA G10  N-methylase Trm11